MSANLEEYKAAVPAKSNPGPNWGRMALWSAGLTVGIPLLWVFLTAVFPLMGWLGVLPVIILTPIGIIVTIILAIIAAANPRRSTPSPGAAATKTDIAKNDPNSQV